MTSLSCLALIIYMEARNQSIATQSLVADVAIERAYQEKLTICTSLKKPKSYSWNWDGIHTIVNKSTLAAIEPIAKKELKHPTVKGRFYFNNCKLGKRFKTRYRMKRSESLCFY